MVGTTSACAENTRYGNDLTTMWGNYLRVRGEYRYRISGESSKQELPPRARRILGPGRGRRRTLGTTSACAENTPGAASRSCAIWNYLRVRGEYPFDWAIGRTPWELPPRARRIRFIIILAFPFRGTTSACAENTHSGSGRGDCLQNYLRVRGEYTVVHWARCMASELPPRARRILHGRGRGAYVIGTTSACAENTPFSPSYQ